MSSDTPTLLSPKELTPQPTGSDISADSGDGSAPPKSPTRRQTASTYPNNQRLQPKPFSRSAAKRESVMMLGSIEHLQHYFTKTGLAAPTNPFKPNSGAAPAIGGLQLNMQPPIINLPEGKTLPPTPVVPERPNIPPPIVERSYSIDPESIKPGVIDDLNALCAAWGVDELAPPPAEGTSSSQGAPTPTTEASTQSKFDVLAVLKTTTQTVRSVRNYLLSLPDESVTTIREDYRSKIASTPAKKRPRTSDANSNTSDPLALIRRCALDVLAVLRELEEAARIPLDDDAYDAGSDTGGLSRVASPSSMSADLAPEAHSDHDASFAFSLVKVRGRDEHVPVWEDEEDEFNAEPQIERERWDEKLVLQSGWLYSQDLSLNDLEHERYILAHYVDTVDEVLFGGKKGGKRGWEMERAKLVRRERSDADLRKARRVSDGVVEGQPRVRGGRKVVSAGLVDALKEMSLAEEPENLDALGAVQEEVEVDEDDELPEWAQAEALTKDALGTMHALLRALLPERLRSHLPEISSSRKDLLNTLASGQLLCEAYNVGVRRSRKPWGYVDSHSIHDLITMEASSSTGSPASGRGWTFRRVDNLRIWVAALKLRYMLPIITPSQPVMGGRSPGMTTSALPSPLAQKFSAPETPMFFDALLVARCDEGWEDMLFAVVKRWAQAVAEERRGTRL